MVDKCIHSGFYKNLRMEAKLRPSSKTFCKEEFKQVQRTSSNSKSATSHSYSNSFCFLFQNSRKQVAENPKFT